MEVSETLVKELTQSAAAEVAELSAAALRSKVMALLLEAQGRARLEGIRLAESLERNDRKWTAQVRREGLVAFC